MLNLGAISSVDLCLRVALTSLHPSLFPLQIKSLKAQQGDGGAAGRKL